jgi:hypothetical protein
MTTFASILADVYTLTNRPDLVAETTLAVKSATLKAHMTDFYSKDIYEVRITTDTADYIAGIDVYSIISNFRSLKYLRKYDIVTATAGDFINVLEPEEVLDDYGVEKVDVCYMAGRVLELKSSTEVDNFILGCYVAPIVTTSGYSSWIADLYPDAIIYEAARVVFKTIGYDEQSATYERLVAEAYSLLKMTALSDVGY